MIVYQDHNSLEHNNYNAFIYRDCSWYYHFHKNLELVHVMEGRLLATLDNRTETLDAGEFALILGNQIHAYQSPEPSLVWIGVFSEDFVHEFARHMKNKQGETARFVCEPQLLEWLRHSLLQEGNPGLFTLKSCLYAACDQYLRQVRLVERAAGNDTLVYKLLDYVLQHFTEDVTLEGAAQALGYEYHYLSRCFHQAFHVNFRQFVNQYRIEYARNLLQESDLDITGIAMKSGFQSIRNFNRVFREMTGTEPRRFWNG